MSTSCTDANRAGESSSSLFDSVSAAFSSFFPTAHADDGKDDDEEEEGGDDEEKEEGGDEEEEEAEDDEDDEPEDQLPGLLERCQEKECSTAKHHFIECQERVEAGNGFKDENCVEEFFHLMHCSTNCAAPRLFSELK